MFLINIKWNYLYCVKIILKGPTSEALGVEEMELSYLAICQFATLGAFSVVLEG